MVAAAVGGAECEYKCACLTVVYRWFKWLHAAHPCVASKAWALSQGLDAEDVGGGEVAEVEGGSACMLS